jgi:hypothetical protein
MTIKLTTLMKVRIFGNNHKTIHFGEFPLTGDKVAKQLVS